MLVFPNSLKQVTTLVATIANGLFGILHNGFALLGVVVVLSIALLTARPDVRQTAQDQIVQWLAQSHLISAQSDLLAPSRPEGSELATATDPEELPKQQAAVAQWLSKKYRVAPEPISALVNEAYQLSAKAKIEPTLILAVMAIESGFNPFAQSQMGAQGLMQVLTKVHSEKYDNFGGTLAAFDPVSNVRVGVTVLLECITKAGSIEGGLRYYVGAANSTDDGGYTDKVLTEQARLKLVAQGKRVDPQMVISQQASALTSDSAKPLAMMLPAGNPAPVRPTHLLALGL